MVCHVTVNMAAQLAINGVNSVPTHQNLDHCKTGSLATPTLYFRALFAKVRPGSVKFTFYSIIIIQKNIQVISYVLETSLKIGSHLAIDLWQGKRGDNLTARKPIHQKDKQKNRKRQEKGGPQAPTKTTCEGPNAALEISRCSEGVLARQTHIESLTSTTELSGLQFECDLLN